jgi:hypothetical protein
VKRIVENLTDAENEINGPDGETEKHERDPETQKSTFDESDDHDAEKERNSDSEIPA